jgi:uncharacterized protein (TIGR03000 family)
VNGRLTTSSGDQRQFISRGLLNGQKYSYEVRAELPGDDGRMISKIKSIQLRAGEASNISFEFEDAAEEPIIAEEDAPSTKLTLHVPADAKVFLAGQETRSTGEVREFATGRLSKGQDWENYTVRVVANVDGRDIEKEQTISLTAGEDRELTFDFAAEAIARTAAN